MKVLLLSLVLPAFSVVALAQAAAPATESPVPVTQAWPAAPAQVAPPAEQRLYGAHATPLIDPAAAQAVVDKFRAAYGTVSAPRLVIYVNRSLIDVAALKLTGRTESYTEKSADGKITSSKTKAASSYAVKEGSTSTIAPALADQQTVRDIERFVGRAFRNGGAKLADQRTAGVMLSAQPGARLLGDQAVKERDALAQAADIAIEVLISTRTLIAAEISGDTTVAVPDIQMTAIRLKDAAILGQASASDVLGAGAAQAAKKFSPADSTEATALALMEDMLLNAK